MEQFYKWIFEHPEQSIPALGAFIALIFTGIWTPITFLQKVRAEKEQKQFERYHQLIQEFNDGIKGSVYIDSQLNAVYELRFFRKYYPRSERLLEAIIDRWSTKSKTYTQANIDEVKITLSYIKMRKSVWGALFFGTLNVLWPWWK